MSIAIIFKTFVLKRRCINGWKCGSCERFVDRCIATSGGGCSADGTGCPDTPNGASAEISGTYPLCLGHTVPPFHDCGSSTCLGIQRVDMCRESMISLRRFSLSFSRSIVKDRWSRGTSHTSHKSTQISFPGSNGVYILPGGFVGRRGRLVLVFVQVTRQYTRSLHICSARHSTRRFQDP